MLLVVLVVGIVPLVMLGLWLTRTAPRAGERLLRTRLDETLDQAVAQVASRWISERSDLLFLADEVEVQRILERLGTRASEPAGVEPPSSLKDRFEELAPSVLAVSVVSSEDVRLVSVERSPVGSRWLDAGEPLPLGVVVDMGIYAAGDGSRLGTLRAVLDPQALLSPGALPPTTAGLVLAAFDPSSGASLLPLPLEPELFDTPSFEWQTERWLSTRRILGEPPLILAVAAPLTPFIAPFEVVARQGTWLLLAVAIAGLGLVALLTRRMTRRLAHLSEAAQAVAGGDLDRRIEPEGRDEVGRVAHAFNTMAESLRRTLAELTQKESLAAVGEFAATLAHEVRNPLTAIRIDLQYVEEGLPGESPLRTPQSRALREVARLDDTVSRTLEVARSGRIRPRPIDLREPVHAAVRAARPLLDEKAASLSAECGPDPIDAIGDSGALEQLFLNLLRNALEALETGGAVSVELSVDGEDALVTVTDDGCGMPAEVRERIFEPFFSTRVEGTGLGLPISRRIAVVHGGNLAVESEPGAGTKVTVRLPTLAPSAGEKNSKVPPDIL
jgi:signal transduction histidine kinase